MKQLVQLSSPTLPALITAAGERAGMRFLEFFARGYGDSLLDSGKRFCWVRTNQ
jgi:hypothetical protein